MATLGPYNIPAIPPRPRFVVLTDRDDGTLWVLSHDTTGNYVAINDRGLLRVGDITTAYTDVTVYGPYDGPYLPGHPELRLLVRGGYLGFEKVTPAQVQQARILTRRGVSGTLREIVAPVGYTKFDAPGNAGIIGWEDAP
jgi:hypothetical protein